MQKLLLILTIFVFYSCNKENEGYKRIPLTVTEIQLTDVGKVPRSKPYFEASPGEENTQNCLIKTIYIKKNDSIESIEAYMQEGELYVDIKPNSPYNFFGDDDIENYHNDSTFTVHHVRFKLQGIKRGTYTINEKVDGGGSERIQDYTFNNK